MTKPIDPAELASSAGFKHSSWHKLGTGPWEGTIYPGGWVNGEIGIAIEQRARSWTGGGMSAPSLEALLTKLKRKPSR